MELGWTWMDGCRPVVCRFDPSRKLLIIYILNFSLWYQGKSVALSSSSQHAMHRKFCGRWGTECLNTRFPLSTLCYISGYSMKLRKKHMKQLVI